MNDFKNSVYLGSECVNVITDSFGTRFVCNSKLVNNGQIFIGTGIGDTLEKASKNARENVFFNVGHVPDKREQYNHASESQSAVNTPINKESLKGGGDRQISEKQIDLLNNLCDNDTQKLEELSKRTFNKPYKTLLGKEAHELIQNLIGKK